ncbi:class I SAM-dependent methyltransferase [Histidinibacterium aquaticum]|uniref:Class I SAM-dependent methyltransferase n=1 Tax=Histidinibacterium aquaticum TaxID=2613962 RepID=A0A5J5GQN7_9RHOB|nr:class I SAM-dependent methyltransferase [Histidinibacterium aquaticum]KAA9009712.1 class I SAM-dependent methyltransferase [Histidinibacterium aquaticum]
MTDRVRAQYEAYPYPTRDPRDEATRLVSGSPSDPVEIDHFLFGGRRDWSQGTRILVAGGGTGDGLVQIAQVLAWAGVEAEITYLDLSETAREITEARVAARGLTGVRFVTGSLLDAAELGRFDYIDCCGVLHHLPDPPAGFAALRSALAPGGGIGFMVYAPLGRTGVYPLQEAFGELFGRMTETERLSAAREVMERIPAGHPFRLNPHLGDHLSSDAGFYDLLLHSQDRSYSVTELLSTLEATGLSLVSFVPEGLYDLERFHPVPEGMSAARSMALAEALDGMMKVHVGYAVPQPETRAPATARPDLVPHLEGPADRIAAALASRGRIGLRAAGRAVTVALPTQDAAYVARIDGRASLGEIGAPPETWSRIEAAFRPWNLLRYSSLPPRPE